MDGNGRKKIVIAVLLLLLYLFLNFCGISFSVIRQEKMTGEKMVRMALQYPELVSEIIAVEEGKDLDPRQEWEDQRVLMKKKYQYNALDLQSSQNIAATGIFITGMGSLALCVLFVFYQIIDRKGFIERMKEQKDIERCLQSFLEGDYIVPMSNHKCTNISLWEQLKELGLYFENVKENMMLEEQNTKALITNISHQLKTPLTSLKISLELAESTMKEEDKKKFLERGKDETDKLEKLMNVMVNVSRLENHMIKIKPQIQNIKEGITEAMNAVIMKAHKKQMTLSLDLEKEIYVLYDKKWTTEALANILDNAIKYSPCGTQILVRVSDTINYGIIEIADQGIGIERKDFHRIFRRFYRGKQVQESGQEGAGVGLYLARTIIEQQGGMVSVKSKLGQGSSFQIMLTKNK